MLKKFGIIILSLIMALSSTIAVYASETESVDVETETENVDVETETENTEAETETKAESEVSEDSEVFESVEAETFSEVKRAAPTREQATQWALNSIGAKYDTDKQWGAQCKDFVNQYTMDNFGVVYSGHAKDLIWVTLKPGWTLIKNTPDFIPQPGDIAIWDAWSGNPYGHTGVIVSANINTFDSIDQNWVNFNPNHGSPAARVTHNYTSYNFWGVLRPPFGSGIDTTKPVIEELNFEDWNIGSLGFIVRCRVTAKNGLASGGFNVWTEANGQDDMKWYPGNVENDWVWSYIPLKDYGYFMGNYIIGAYVTDKNGNTSDGKRTNLNIYDVSPPTLNQQTIKDGTYVLKNEASNFVMDVFELSAENMTPVNLYSWNGGTNQKMKFVYQGNGNYLIYPECANGKAIDVLRGNSFADSIDQEDIIDIYDTGDSDAQLFKVVPVGNGEYVLELASMDNYVIGGRHCYSTSHLYLQKYTNYSKHCRWTFYNPDGTKADICNHKYSSVVTTKPTYEKPGIKTNTCSICGDSYTETIPKLTPVKVNGVSLNKDSVTLVKKGDTFQLKANILPSNATNKSVTWSSSNSAIASVSSRGLVTAVSDGTVVITVKTSDGGKIAQCKVTVKISSGTEKDTVEDFVARLYKEILGRNPDSAGLKSWAEVLKSGKEQGAKVAQGFVDSTEFKKRNLSDDAYIKALYRTFFDREADAGGLKAWKKVLESGLSRLHVFKGFAESEEFTKICARYGIKRGNANLTEPRDKNEGVTKFIVRNYRLCLGREADVNGLNNWCNQILTGKNTAKQAAYGFVFSKEFLDRRLSDEAYVRILYRVFMDREADTAGLKSWVNIMKNGKSREHVFNGFADSEEFKKICASYGIK